MSTDNPLIARLRALHEKAKRGTLNAAERIQYDDHRRELARVMLVAQNMTHGGQALRGALRVAQVVKVEIDLGGPAPERTVTIDLATGGFAVVLPLGQPVGRKVSFTLMLASAPGGGPHAMKGTARVASSRQQGATFRVSFAFEDVDPKDVGHLEMVILDYVLARFGAG
jgi:hypothetical protein